MKRPMEHYLDDLHVSAHLAETIRPIFRTRVLGHFVPAFMGFKISEFTPLMCILFENLDFEAFLVLMHTSC